MSLLFKVEGFEGCYCSDCVEKILNSEKKEQYLSSQEGET